MGDQGKFFCILYKAAKYAKKTKLLNLNFGPVAYGELNEDGLNKLATDKANIKKLNEKFIEKHFSEIIEPSKIKLSILYKITPEEVKETFNLKNDKVNSNKTTKFGKAVAFDGVSDKIYSEQLIKNIALEQCKFSE